MAIKFVRCRRVDDHTQTADIAEIALQHLPNWEPIPDEPAPDEQLVREQTATEPTNTPAPTTRKSRTRAATANTTDTKE